jgi:hypothetical protein
MHRTQIYLEENQYQMLRSQARREGRSLAAIIRGILQAHLGGRRNATAQDPFRRVLGIGKGDGSRVAENCEEYLYGAKR